MQTLLRSDQSSQVKGWIGGNTKIGPALDVTVNYDQGRYGVEIKIESLFGDKTCSWVRIVNGIKRRNRNVRRDSHLQCWREVYRETHCETSNLTLSPVSIPCRELKSIDIEPGGAEIDDQIATT